MTTITGMEKLEMLRQNLKIAQNFQPMIEREMEELRKRLQPLAADGRFEHYKVSLQYDNPRPARSRLSDRYRAEEVKQMIKETKNTGHPYPEMKT